MNIDNLPDAEEYYDDTIDSLVKRIDSGAELDIISDSDKITYLVASVRELKKFMLDMSTTMASNPMAKMLGMKVFGGKK